VLNTLLVLTICSIPLYFIFTLRGEKIFELIFGSKWIYAGALAGILMPAYLINFIVSPLSMLLPSLNKLRILAIWQIAYCIAIFTLQFFVGDNFNAFVKSYLIIELISFSLYLMIILFELKKYESEISLLNEPR
jgi:O-antigen/teichoic acid export membrane protein